jgi:site-specific recombinase XerD
LYGYAVEVDVLEDNPVANVKRPRVPNASMSVGLARDELQALLEAAAADGPRSEALITLKSAGQLSPHGLRHTYATSFDRAGVALQEVQDAMGHADPRTTRRYMASHQHLDRHATYAFAAWLRRTPDASD